MDLPMNDENIEQSSDKNVLGNEAMVKFIQLNREVEGKVDTGATTSSLHAENIQVNKANNSVSFSCPELSNGVITMELDGAQEVVSADAGGNTRPMVKMDVEINGIPIKAVSFNLNDRSEMDSPVLIGQNILKVGNFVIDVNKDEAPEREETVQNVNQSDVNRNAEVREAIQVLADNNVTVREIASWLAPTYQ